MSTVEGFLHTEYFERNRIYFCLDKVLIYRPDYQ